MSISIVKAADGSVRVDIDIAAILALSTETVVPTVPVLPVLPVDRTPVAGTPLNLAPTPPVVPTPPVTVGAACKVERNATRDWRVVDATGATVSRHGTKSAATAALLATVVTVPDPSPVVPAAPVKPAKGKRAAKVLGADGLTDGQREFRRMRGLEASGNVAAAYALAAGRGWSKDIDRLAGKVAALAAA